MLSVNSEKPRPSLGTDPSKMSAEELNSVLGPFTAQGGTYEVNGSRLILHPSVAKDPAVMSGTAPNVYVFNLDGKILTLTFVESNTRGKLTNPEVWTLSRIE